MKTNMIAMGLLIIGLAVEAQPVEKRHQPCYTKHWVDSVNASTMEKLKADIPNLIEWYAYEGQEQPAPEPANLVNVIYVKLDDECPE